MVHGEVVGLKNGELVTAGILEEDCEDSMADRLLRLISRVPCTKVLSQEIQFFQETSFCVLQVLLRNFANTLLQLYIDFYTIRMVFESSFQLGTFKVANLKKLWQFWPKMCS